MKNQLSTKNLTCSIDGKDILSNLNIDIKKNDFIGIIGSNGSGKSTFIKHLTRILTPKNGEVLLENNNINELPYKETAKKIAVVSQEQDIPFDFKVYEVVSMGRYPHKKLLDSDTIEDKKIINDALETVGMLDCYRQNYHHLSGGQKQRVLIAKALAQKTNLLILDEPTNHLDIKYKLQIFDVLKNLNITVITALHDLNIAALYCDRIIVLNEGKCYASGRPKEIINSKLLKDVFGVEAIVNEKPFFISYQTNY